MFGVSKIRLHVLKTRKGPAVNKPNNARIGNDDSLWDVEQR